MTDVSDPYFSCDFSTTDVESSRIDRSLYQLLSLTHVASLACLRGPASGATPWICSILFAFDRGLNLYFLSPPTAEHSLAIEAWPHVAVAVADSQQTGDAGKRGIQAIGTSRRLVGTDLNPGLHAYRTRFPAALELLASEATMEASGMESRMWVIAIDEVKIFDESSFGEETWITPRLIRR